MQRQVVIAPQSVKLLQEMVVVARMKPHDQHSVGARPVADGALEIAALELYLMPL